MEQKSYAERIESIKNNLYLGGGVGQARNLLTMMMGGFGEEPDLDPSVVLGEISHLLKDYRRMTYTSGIIPAKYFTTAKNNKPYACLDKNLKFCVKHYNTKEWDDVLYVFPYMNNMTAYDIENKQVEHIYCPDI